MRRPATATVTTSIASASPIRSQPGRRVHPVGDPAGSRVLCAEQCGELCVWRTTQSPLLGQSLEPRRHCSPVTIRATGCRGVLQILTWQNFASARRGGAPSPSSVTWSSRPTTRLSRCRSSSNQNARLVAQLPATIKSFNDSLERFNQTVGRLDRVVARHRGRDRTVGRTPLEQWRRGYDAWPARWTRAPAGRSRTSSTPCAGRRCRRCGQRPTRRSRWP